MNSTGPNMDPCVTPIKMFKSACALRNHEKVSFSIGLFLGYILKIFFHIQNNKKKRDDFPESSIEITFIS